MRWVRLAGTAAAAAIIMTAVVVAPGADAAPVRPAQPGVTLTSAAAGRTLREGSRGARVRVLQRRLARLRYYPGRVNGRFGLATLEAVWAFQEVQGLHLYNHVTHTFWVRLRHPRRPRVLVRHGGALRIEINLRDDVLVLYRHNRVALISHVSPGGGYYYCSSGGCGYAVTPAGNYRTRGFMPGWVRVPLGAMYNPVFFIGTAFAIHGDIPVPRYPASHGCVRIPMDIAAFFHKLIRAWGTPVYIRR